MRPIAVDVPGLTDPGLAFPSFVRAGDWVHLSGAVALDPDGELVGAGDVGNQTEAALRSIEMALAAAGGSLNDLVSVTAYLADAAHLSAFDGAWRATLGMHRPARTTVVASPTDARFLVELQAVAWLPTEEVRR